MPDGSARVLVAGPWTQTPTQTETIPPSLDCIREVVCAEFHLSRLELYRDDSGPRVLAGHRMIAWCASLHGHPTDDIAGYLRCDDTTIWFMVNRVDRLIDADPLFADRVIGIARRLPRVGG